MNREQLEEELTCTCGAGHGSMEGHMPWCDWTESNVAVEPTMTREQKLEEALGRLLACPAIADGNHGEPAWGCKETAEAEAFARAALSAPKAEAVTVKPAHAADGMTVTVSMGGGAYGTIINPQSFSDGGPEWIMRYGDPESIRYTVASLLETFDYLLSDGISAKEASRRLSIMRSVRRALDGQS